MTNRRARRVSGSFTSEASTEQRTHAALLITCSQRDSHRTN